MSTFISDFFSKSSSWRTTQQHQHNWNGSNWNSPKNIMNVVIWFHTQTCCTICEILTLTFAHPSIGDRTNSSRTLNFWQLNERVTTLYIVYNTTTTQIHHHNETWALTSKITSKWQQSKTPFFLAHHFLHSSRFTTGNGSSSGASAGSAGSSFGAASGASPTGSGSAEGVGIGVAPSLVMPAVVRAIHCFTLHQMGWIMMVRKKNENWWSSYGWFLLLAFRTRGTQYRTKTKQPQVPNIRWEIERDMESLWTFAEQMRTWWAWFSGDTYLRVLHGSNFNIPP